MDGNKMQKSFPDLSYPRLRDLNLKSTSRWLKSKVLDDGAEGLWRIHDGLYDLEEFASKHPGGKEWLIITKGTDITEAFETHHIANTPKTILPKYFIREAKTPRNYPFTFDENGFYKTLQSKIASKLTEIPKNEKRKSEKICDLLLIALVISCPIYIRLVMSKGIIALPLFIIPALVLSSLTVSAHNFFHQRDNWRMYLFNLTGLSFKDWRINHALSHHLHTNTAHDVELSALEPFLQFLPKSDKSLIAQLGIIYFPLMFVSAIPVLFLIRLSSILFVKGEAPLHPSELLFAALPTWMYITGGTTIPITLGLWFLIIMGASYFIVFFGLTAGHHNALNFFEGDIPRDTKIDWGLHQLDTMVERVNYMGEDTLFAALTRFGDHALHHLFPTIDQAYLKHLYPVFLEHLEKHDEVLRTTTQQQAFFSKCRQLLRKKPNDFRKSMY